MDKDFPGRGELRLELHPRALEVYLEYQSLLFVLRESM